MISVVLRFGTRSALLAAIALRAQTTPPPREPPKEIQQSLRFVPGRMAHYHVPGVSLALIHNERIDWTQSFGVAGPSGAPVRPDTLFQASSISMPVTAVAALRLVEEGKLNLDVDVN